MKKKVAIDTNVQKRNEEIAEQNRRFFRLHNLSVINMIGSPGAGKTSILEIMAKKYGARFCVITGDIQTTIDADRINAAGAQAIQIETGGSCHLTALMVQKALSKMNLDSVKHLVIENIGNLVCPSTYDLGEKLKVAVLSVPEGDEKPVKYPALFIRAQIVLVNKVDLLPFVEFDIERIREDCFKLNNHIKIFPLSCKTEEGFNAWLDHFKTI